MDIVDIFVNAYQGYAAYLWHEVTHPSWYNYFYVLTTGSLFFLILEVVLPWRKGQLVLRKDFWLDIFYMYFNFFLFSLLIFEAGSEVVVQLFNRGILSTTGVDLQANNPMVSWPLWSILLVGFLVRDFVQWWTHRLLHRVEWLWRFHQVHHSVKEMGFAAHLRYHWMETIVYRTIEYLPLALLGVGLYDFFVIHAISLLIGHHNHANVPFKPRYFGAVIGAIIGAIIGSAGLESTIVTEPSMTTLALGLAIGVLTGSLLGRWVIPYLFNNPAMHIWHHAKELPGEHPYGVNFGISLALWDYIFKTNYMPHDGRDIELGFPDDERFPQTFLSQITYGVLH